MSTTDLSRSQFITRAGAGGLALVAGGTILGVAAGPALAAPAAGDVEIAKLAATAELLAQDFYRRAIASGRIRGDELAYMRAALTNEADHYAALRGVLGSATPRGLRFKYPAGTFGTKARIAATGTALETAFVGAYMFAVTALRDNGLKGVAAQIGANEAQHLSAFREIGAGGNLAANPSLPVTRPYDSAAKITAAVSPFIAS